MHLLRCGLRPGVVRGRDERVAQRRERDDDEHADRVARCRPRRHVQPGQARGQERHQLVDEDAGQCRVGVDLPLDQLRVSHQQGAPQLFALAVAQREREDLADEARDHRQQGAGEIGPGDDGSHRLRIGTARGAADDRVLLRGEVVEEGARGDAGGVRDLRDGRGVEAALERQPHRGLVDRGAGQSRLAVAQRFARGGGLFVGHPRIMQCMQHCINRRDA